MKSKFNNIRWITLLVGLLLLVAFYGIYTDCFSPNVSSGWSNSTFLYVRSDKNYTRFLSDLNQQGVLENPNSFRRIANLLGLEKRLKPGRYAVKAGMSNYDLMKLLFRGQQASIDVVLKYAERKEDLARFFGKHLEVDSTTFLMLLNDEDFDKGLGFDSNTVLCMFIPNTYNFYWNTNSVELLNRMKKEYQQFWNQERLAQCVSLHMSQVEVMVLASIVQKESNKIDEMPTIASVYLNRIQKGMPLQADPTVIYAWNDKSIRRVTSVHTAMNSPYNTYLNTGLPPGPICIPSIQAIDAVLRNEHTTYLYFCAREDFSGYHSFASTFDQHQQNARRYQRALNARGVN